MTFVVSTDTLRNTAGLEVEITSLDEYKEYLRKEYSSCCLSAIEELKTIKEFRDQVVYHSFDCSSSEGWYCRECDRGSDWWQVTNIKEIKDERTSKERILASLGESASEFEPEDIAHMASSLNLLLKRANNKNFLESLCELLWDYSVKPEHIQTIIRVEESL